MLQAVPTLVLLLLLPVLAAAQDEAVVRIRARSELRVAEIGRAAQSHGVIGVRLGVILRDAPSQEPLAGQELVLRLRPQNVTSPRHHAASILSQRLNTGRDGHATAVFNGLLPGRYLATARYEGDDLHDLAVAPDLIVDLDRRPARLRLDALQKAPVHGPLPLLLDLDAEGAPIGVGDEPIHIDLFVSGVPVPLAIRDGHGALTVPLPPGPQPLSQSALHGGDRVALFAAYAGDSLHAPAQARALVLLTTETQLTLDPPPDEVARSGRLLLSGSARDEDGPLSGEQIEILATQEDTTPPEDPRARLLGSTTTDAAGRFRLVVEHLSLPSGTAQIVARSVPGRSYRQPGTSTPAILAVLPPEPVSVLYFVVPLGLTLGGLIGVSGWRRRHFLLRALACLRPASIASALPGPAGKTQLGPGVQLAHKSLVSTLLSRRQVDLTVDGVILDAAFEKGVSNAWVSAIAEGAIAADPAATAAADGHGRFVLPDLAAGVYLVLIGAPGYLAEYFPAVLPHRGELRGVQVALAPIRGRILLRWRQVTMPLFPGGGPERDLLTWTPREVCGHVEGRKGGPAFPMALVPLQRLTELVEDAYYSSRTCTGETLAEVEALAERITALLPADAQRLAVQSQPTAPGRPPRRGD